MLDTLVIGRVSPCLARGLKESLTAVHISLTSQPLILDDRPMLDTPVIAPEALRMGEIVREMFNNLPYFVTRNVS